MFKTINGFTKQKIKDVINQRFTKKSMGPDGTCVYRGPEGSMCVVGCFIPDTEIDEDFLANINQRSVTGLFSKRPHLKDLMPIEYTGLIEFQEAHDEGYDCTKRDLIEWVENNVEETI
jgi:hypothetical protein